MRGKRFLVLVAALVVVASALYGSGVMGTSAEAGDEQSFRWLAGAGMFDGGFLCGGPPGCPDVATTTAGEHAAAHSATIELTGEGTLVVKDLKGELKPQKGRRSVTGGGSFRIDHAGVIRVGTWTAKRLVSFEDFGISPCVVGTEPGCDGAVFDFPTAHAGLAVIEVEGVVDVTGAKFDAILTVGCQLPAVPDAGLEGIQLDVLGGLNFNDSAVRSTLFIDLG